ncbi:hypothetical protein COL940_005154 [Colletotrichum noveboracense]|nr:hypothetical protein COL940_005154 [Colletotrichum noveboracense]
MAVTMGLSAGYTEYGIKAAGTAIMPFLFLFYASHDIAYTPMSYGYAVYIVINAILLVIQYFKFPETKDRTIEEIATIFDGSQATTVVYAQGESMERDVRSVREEPEAKSM